jgi:hypothetical protein
MIALNVFGPALKYRLDLLKQSSYDVRSMIHILTDRVSYEKFYTEFHDDYVFLFVEDYMSQYELSLKHELIPNVFENEKDHFENSNAFYKKNNNFFSFDIHRFVFPYFISKGIKNFVIIDSDLILTNNQNVIDEFFNTITNKTFYAPSLGQDFNLNVKQKFWDNLNNEIVPKDFTLPNELTLFDGWLRGFNFETIDDAQKFFDLWNSSYLELLEQRQNPIVQITKNGEGPLIWSNEWIFSHCVKIFELVYGYTIDYSISFNPGNVILPNKPNVMFGKHCPRPEDNLFYIVQKYLDENGEYRYPSRGAWHDFRFDYDCERTTSSFIQKNKEELVRYYESNGLKVTATDTHIFTEIKQ